MVNQKKTTVARKQAVKAPAASLKKSRSKSIVITPGSFLDRTGGMVPTVRLGRRASVSKP